jgi:hypothetical protein
MSEIGPEVEFPSPMIGLIEPLLWPALLFPRKGLAESMKLEGLVSVSVDIVDFAAGAGPNELRINAAPKRHARHGTP